MGGRWFWFTIVTGLTERLRLPHSKSRHFCRGGKACLTVVRTLLGQMNTTDLLLDLQNTEGDTAAHLAVRFNDVFLIELLLKAGADSTVKNKQEKTLVECLPPGSKESQRKPIASLVKKYKK